MPRRNRPHHERRKTNTRVVEQPTTAQLTPDEAALDLVRRGLAPVTILVGTQQPRTS